MLLNHEHHERRNHVVWIALAMESPPVSDICNVLFTDGITTWIGHAGRNCRGEVGFYGYDSIGTFRDGDVNDMVMPWGENRAPERRITHWAPISAPPGD